MQRIDAIDLIAAATSVLSRVGGPLCAARNITTDWEAVVRGTLTYKSGSIRLPPGIARSALSILIQELSPSARLSHEYALGSAAKAAQHLVMIHDHDEADPTRPVRAACIAFLEIKAAHARLSGVRPFARSDTLALWILGAICFEETLESFALSPHFDRKNKRNWGEIVRWPSHIHAERIKDIHLLAKATPRLHAAVEDVLQLLPEVPEFAIGIQRSDSDLTGNETTGECYCADPTAFVQAHWGHAGVSCWRPLSPSPSLREYFLQIEKFSGARGDLLIAGDRAVVVDIQGFLDAVLVLCLNQGTTDRNTKWHEQRVQSEVRSSWHATSKVLANHPWVEDPSSLAQANVSRNHISELDVAVLGDEWFVDIQAKCAQSATAAGREKLAAVDALRQHQLLAQAGPAGIYMIRPVTKNRAEKLFRTAPFFPGNQSNTLVAITVGTESVHQWSVGNSVSETDRFPRVMTTLDHMRIVNRYVPTEFRAVYWLDRFAQESDQLRFVDEIDFLEKWGRVLRSESSAIQILGPNNFVLATDGLIQTHLYLSNSMAASSRRLPKPIQTSINAAQETLARSEPNITAPNFMTALRQISSRKPPGYLSFLRAVLGNNLAKAETGLLNNKDLLFGGGIGTWALVSGIHKSQPVGVQPDADFLVYRSGTEWELVRRNDPSSLSAQTNRQTARFRGMDALSPQSKVPS